jgi:uncharacterized tellurite resistance protein B-like protein
MIDSLKKFFDSNLLPDDATDEQTREREIQYATAALLIEMSRADFEEDPIERALITAMLRDTFDLEDEMLDELMSLADDASNEATDVYQFTTLVNDHYNYADKSRLIENLWRVAYADGRLDKYEEQMLRKVSGLLHISHADFIKAKVDVLAKLENE